MAGRPEGRLQGVLKKDKVAGTGSQAAFFQQYFKEVRCCDWLRADHFPCLLCSLLDHRAISRR